MFPIITLTGDAAIRGEQYGRAAAALVAHSIASYARLFAYRRGMDWAAAQDAALAYLPLLEIHAPEQVAEMRGLARGATVPFGAILALNARTELMAGQRPPTAHPDYEAATARNIATNVPQHADEPRVVGAPVPASGDHGECTTVAAQPSVTRTGQTLLAQTWDWTGDQRAACVVLRIEVPNQPPIITVTEAGILAKIGMNGAGFAVSLNILGSRGDGQVPGMPVHILLRRLLDVQTVDAARHEINRVPPGASSCITVADAHGAIASFELSPSAIGEIVPSDGLLSHTNHCLAPETQVDENPLPLISSSHPRLDRAGALIADRRGALDVSTLIAVLRDETNAPNAICRRPDPALPPTERVESVLGVVMDCTTRILHLAPDVPADVEFTPIAVE